MVAWLVYVHASNPHDVKSSEKCLQDMQRNLKNGTSAYVIFFGPTLSSPCSLRYIDKAQDTVLATRENKGFDLVKQNLNYFAGIIKSAKVDVRGICFHTHGGTCGLGKWHGWDRPFLSITDASACLVEPFPKAGIVCFDSCDQGSMGCMYELPKTVAVIVASPAFHPYSSVLSTKAFGDLGKMSSRSELLQYGHRITCQWYRLSKESWRGMLVFDTRYIPIIAKEVAKHIEELYYDKKSQIDKLDANIHDLYTAARNVPHIQKLIEECVSASCRVCFKNCNKRIHGMSIDPHLPRKWIPAFKASKWYKEIVKGKKGFEHWRKGY